MLQSPRRTEPERILHMRPRLGPTALILSLVCLSACGGSRVLLSPAPARIDSLEGHARIWLTQPEDSRSKFVFLLNLPDRGYIEVSDFLGRSLYRIQITELGAFFIIPSKKVYWKGEETEIIERFLGFPLNLQEMIGLISGDWKELTDKRLQASSWRLERDTQGRIVSGRRDALGFAVEEFIDGTRFPRSLRFEHPANSGRLKILKMDFNRPNAPGVFTTDDLKKYTPKTWAEIQALLNNED
jgi:outer membrane biogenesis lipoprotein LolB